MQNIGAVGNVQRFADIMVGNQNAEAAVLELRNQIADFGNGDRINTGQRFVEQDEVWLAGQSPGNFQSAPFAAGQGNCRRLAQMSD